MVPTVRKTEKSFSERVERRVHAALEQLLAHRGDDTSAEELIALTFEVADDVADGVVEQLAEDIRSQQVDLSRFRRF